MIEILKSMCIDSLIKHLQYDFEYCDSSTLVNIHKSFV